MAKISKNNVKAKKIIFLFIVIEPPGFVKFVLSEFIIAAVSGQPPQGAVRLDCLVLCPSEARAEGSQDGPPRFSPERSEGENNELSPAPLSAGLERLVGHVNPWEHGSDVYNKLLFSNH